MSQLIKLTVTSINGSTKNAGSYIFDVDDIVTPLRSRGTKTYFSARQEKGTVAGAARNNAKKDYEVTETLSAISAMSYKLLPLTVMQRRLVTIKNESYLFNSSRVSEAFSDGLTYINTGSGLTVTGSKFYYCEDGDPLPVLYYILEPQATVITLQNETGGYVPYTGANANINLGAFGITSKYEYITGVGNTSATTSFSVSNTSNAMSLRVTDDGSVYNQGGGNISGNTAFGRKAFLVNTSGTNNTFYGYESGLSNTQGNSNTGFGSDALPVVTTGSFHTAVGHGAGFTVSTANALTAVGYFALNLATGIGSVGVGFQAGSMLSTGTYNIFVGYNAGNGITTGGFNTIIGSNITVLTSSTASNIILSDGNGNVKYRWDTTYNNLTGTIKVVPTAGLSHLNAPPTTTPTTLNDGDIWYDGTNWKARVGGVTKTFTLV